MASTNKAQRRPAGVALLAMLAMMIAASCSAISVLPMRVDNPSPDGDGVVFIKLQSDPTDVAPANFQILSTTFLAGQSLKLWNTATNDCTGTVLNTNDLGMAPRAPLPFPPLQQEDFYKWVH
jgi:hypothetical protein